METFLIFKKQAWKHANFVENFFDFFTKELKTFYYDLVNCQILHWMKKF